MKTKTWRNHAMQEGVFFLLLSGWLLYYSIDAFGRSLKRDWTQSPGLFPLIVSGVIALLALCILYEGMKETAKEAEATAEKKGKTPQVLILLGISLLYYFALAVVDLPYMGVTIASLTFRISTFEIATAVFLVAMMLYMGVRSKPVLVLVPVCSSVFLSVMFRTLLRVMLP